MTRKFGGICYIPILTWLLFYFTKNWSFKIQTGLSPTAIFVICAVTRTLDGLEIALSQSDRQTYLCHVRITVTSWQSYIANYDIMTIIKLWYHDTNTTMTSYQTYLKLSCERNSSIIRIKCFSTAATPFPCVKQSQEECQNNGNCH